MKFAIAKISTKGQIVIPTFLRGNIKKGDEFLIVKDDERIIMKNMKKVAESIKDDLIFSERIEKSWNNYKKGKFVSKSKEDFLKNLRSC
jgi:bifunctional DNA-binding transcriptional regulator/antitoxin component of YhaV-PrlF toxin-antitoxin module